MPLVDMKDLLNHAYRNHYAVGAFGPASVDCATAIVAAAERSRSPVILAFDEERIGTDVLEPALAAAEFAAQRAAVPVAIELERADSVESAARGINLGCNGVTVDACGESFPAAVAIARRVAEVAQSCGVAVEGALGDTGGNRDASESEGPADSMPPTSIEEAKAFVQRAGVTCLAVSLGAMNGDRRRGRMRLDVDRLRRLHETVHIPLAFHAGNGLTDDQFHKLIQNGVAKIRYDTVLADVAGEYLRTNGRGDGRRGFRDLVDGMREAIVAEVERCMQRWGSAGRAAEVLVQCRAWQPVQHVIVYNIEGGDDGQVETMMARGREMLATIPGVRRVVTGWSLSDHPRFRCCWVVEFAHDKVIESYRDHPVHQQFANELFRPLAGDRITIDFSPRRPEAEAELSPGLRARA